MEKSGDLDLPVKPAGRGTPNLRGVTHRFSASPAGLVTGTRGALSATIIGGQRMKKDLLVVGLLASVLVAGLGVGIVVWWQAMQPEELSSKTIKPKPEPIAKLTKKEEPKKASEPEPKEPIRVAVNPPTKAAEKKDEPPPKKSDNENPPAKVEPEPKKKEDEPPPEKKVEVKVEPKVEVEGRAEEAAGGEGDHHRQ